MADITKCFGNNCPLKESCYRFLAIADELYQSYIETPPYNEETKECELYWEINKED